MIATDRLAKPAASCSPNTPTSLPGSAWNVAFPERKGRGETGMTDLFCKTDRWQVVPPSGVGPQGTQRVEGARLITRAEDGKVAQYSLRRAPGWVELDDGGSLMRLHDEATARC